MKAIYILIALSIVALSGCVEKNNIGIAPPTHELPVDDFNNYRITTFVYDGVYLQYAATPKGIFYFKDENVTADININPMQITQSNIPMYVTYKNEEYILSGDCPVNNDLEMCLRRFVHMAQQTTDDVKAIEENRIWREAELMRLDTEVRVNKTLIDIKGIQYNAAKQTIINENCKNALNVPNCTIEATKRVFGR